MKNWIQQQKKRKVKDETLVSLQEAVMREDYEICPSLIKSARLHGADIVEIRSSLARSLSFGKGW